MAEATVGPAGFYRRAAAVDHFRTAAGNPALAGAVLRLAEETDAALGHPAALDLVDLGAGDGALLCGVLDQASRRLRRRLRPCAVELAGRPAGLPPGMRWRDRLATGLTGVLVANEWLDTRPVDVVVRAPDGPRLLEVDCAGRQRPGARPGLLDWRWLTRWWPLPEPGRVGEVGWRRDRAWRAAVGHLRAGTAVAIDYPADSRRHLDGTLTAYRAGRQVRPVPDGRCDVTAAVHFPAVRSTLAGSGRPTVLLDQRAAVRRLAGTAGPADLPDAAARAELDRADGFGGFRWLVSAVGIALPGPLRTAAVSKPAADRP
jgi:SAM-dependent MidA family methyltransferase